MIGVIGGTGFYRFDEISNTRCESVATPFGDPSAPIMIGELNGREVAFLARHGLHHEHLPSEVNYRANLWALKAVGVRRVIAISAVGSLRQDIAPGDFTTPSQYLDFTKGRRAPTYFGDGLVAHVSTAQPTCSDLAQIVANCGRSLSINMHTDTVYACVEGPRLGTRAESHFLRGAGADIVGMTNVPEAFLAREAQLCYCSIGIVTDYDCWQSDPTLHVAVDKVLDLYRANLGRAQRLINLAIGTIAGDCACSCRSALATAIVTPEHVLNETQRHTLAVLRL